VTPTTLARYIAHGISAVDPFDLPALRDALCAELGQACALADAARLSGDADRTKAADALVRHIDAAYFAVEAQIMPTPESVRCAHDARVQDLRAQLALIDERGPTRPV
jgi:hypothetical protein